VEVRVLSSRIMDRRSFGVMRTGNRIPFVLAVGRYLPNEVVEGDAPANVI
jgi:hypothetical protein